MTGTTIHRYWHTGLHNPPDDPWLRAVITGLHPGDRLHDWTDKDLPTELGRRLATDPHADDPRHRANITRWWLLNRHGGIWLDHDVIPLRPLPDGAWTAALPGHPTSCAMRLPAAHPLTERMLTEINRPGRRGGTPVRSGDRLLARFIQPSDHLDTHLLPFDAAGRAVPGAEPWCVHRWATTAPRTLRH